MLDTNSVSQIAQAAPAAQNALNAWHLVALGAGAYLAHAYHSIKGAGGIKNIFKGLWSGDEKPAPVDLNVPAKLTPNAPEPPIKS